jgi:hypothetical protein
VLSEDEHEDDDAENGEAADNARRKGKERVPDRRRAESKRKGARRRRNRGNAMREEDESEEDEDISSDDDDDGFRYPGLPNTREHYCWDSRSPCGSALYALSLLVHAACMACMLTEAAWQWIDDVEIVAAMCAVVIFFAVFAMAFSVWSECLEMRRRRRGGRRLLVFPLKKDGSFRRRAPSGLLRDSVTPLIANGFIAAAAVCMVVAMGTVGRYDTRPRQGLEQARARFSDATVRPNATLSADEGAQQQLWEATDTLDVYTAYVVMYAAGGTAVLVLALAVRAAAYFFARANEVVALVIDKDIEQAHFDICAERIAKARSVSSSSSSSSSSGLSLPPVP